MTEPETLDYAIVGAGVSGLYTAWRLLSHDPGLKVRVFESSDRIGGRLLTWNPAGEDAGLRAELGGMRFFAQQELVTGLIDHIGLGPQRVPFFTDGPGLIWSLRGYRMAANDAPTAGSRYRIRTGEDMAPFDLVNSVIDTVLAQNGITRPPTTRKGWDEIKPRLTYRGRPLWTVGFWNLLYDVLSPEAYRYVVDAFGYYTPSLNWNAAESFESVSLDFTSNPQYETLAKGYDQIPKTLAQRIDAATTDPVIRTGSTVTGFEVQPDRSVLVHFEDGAPDVHATNLILGLPRRSLELLWPSTSFNLHTNTHLRRLVRSVRPYPAFKLFLLYEQRWWEQYGFGGERIEHGRSVTDMPIRQTYYMRPDACETGADCEKYGLLMASYDDSIAVDFWQGLEPGPIELERFNGGLATKMEEAFRILNANAREAVAQPKFDPPPMLHLAPQLMIDYARQQIAWLHGMSEHQVPQPLLGAFADWSLDPFGGGWHFWEPQINVEETMPAIRHPVPEANVYIIGEAYSGAQGWVEGALTTAEKTLKDDLHIPQPDWLKNIYLGW